MVKINSALAANETSACDSTYKIHCYNVNSVQIVCAFKKYNFPFAETVINKRGQVRPKEYNSKFKRFKVEGGDDAKEENCSTPSVTINDEQPLEHQYTEPGDYRFII